MPPEAVRVVLAPVQMETLGGVITAVRLGVTVTVAVAEAEQALALDTVTT